MQKIFIVVVVFLLPISFLIFHDKGNDSLRPYFANYLEGKLVEDMKIEVSHLKIDLNYIEFDAVLNDFINIKAKGELSLFRGDLDIVYTLKSNQEKIDINGTVRGSLLDMKIVGEGEALKSNIVYAFKLEDDSTHDVKIKIDNADIASFLRLTAQPAYAMGKVDLNVDIANLEKQSTKANVHIMVNEAILNSETFKEKFAIELPRKVILRGNLNSKVCNTSFQMEGVVKSNLATLNLSRTYYNIKTKELSSDYRLLIPRLSKLMTESGKKLRGKLEVLGTFQRKNAKVYLTGKCKDFGGRIVFNLKENKLNAHMNAVEIEKLLHLFGEKPYVRGKIMADIELDDFKKREGTFNFKIKDTKIINDIFRKELNLNFEEPVDFSLKAKGSITPEVIEMEAKLDSDILEYSSSDIKYKLSSKALSSSYLLHVPKLSKLTALTKRKLRGEFSINGKLNYEDEMIITGNSQNLGGDIEFKFKAQKLRTKIDNISVEKLMQVLNYPQVFKAKLVGTFKYDFLRSFGRFTSTLNQAELLNTYLRGVIKEIRGVNLRGERYTHTYFNATFYKNLVDINFKAQSKSVLLSIPSGKINQVNNKIDAYYKVKVDNRNLEGKIMGDLFDPEITLDSSKYIQKNMMSIMKDNMSTDGMSEFGMGKKESNMMRGMMGGFFD